MKITLIGAGNVATHLGWALQQAGHEVVGVWSRTLDSAMLLAERLHAQAYSYQEACEPTDSTLPTSDLCIVAVKDDALADVSTHLLPLAPKAIWVHTAGSVPMEVLTGKGALHTGVFYPMQTFSKCKEVRFAEVPLFLEASDDATLQALHHVADSLGTKHYDLDGEGRKYLHLAAVFACNFTNHCYALSAEILQRIHLPFDIMLPLVQETAEKVHHLPPHQAQTGPAARHDAHIIAQQETLLADQPMLRALYKALSDSIEQRINPTHDTIRPTED